MTSFLLGIKEVGERIEFASVNPKQSLKRVLSLNYNAYLGSQKGGTTGSWNINLFFFFGNFNIGKCSGWIGCLVFVEAFSEDEAEISSNKSRGCQELKADENGNVLIKKKKSRLKKRCR